MTESSERDTARTAWDRPAERSPLTLAWTGPWRPAVVGSPSSVSGAVREAVLRETAGLQQELDRVYRSRSWRWTAPLRVGASKVTRTVNTARRLRPVKARAKVAYALLQAGGPGAVLDRIRRLQASASFPTSRAPAPVYDTTATVAAEPWPADVPLVSIVIPNYNNGAFLPECFAALKRLTMKRFEVIVVDSASADPDSVRILEELEADPPLPFRVLRRPERHLLGCNRNAGAAQAHGRYVCFLDPDDVLAPTYLDVCLFLLEFQAYDVAGTGVRYFGDSQGCWGDIPMTSTLSEALQRCPTTAPACVDRELLLQAGGFHDAGLGGALIYEDWKFWVRVLAVGARLRNVPAQLLEVRVHAGGQSRHTAIPAMSVQRAAIAHYNRDVLTDEALLRSDRATRTRLVVRGAEAAVRSTEPRPAVLLVVDDPQTCGRDASVRATAASWRRSGLHVVVVAEGAASPRAADWIAAADLCTDDVHVLGQTLPTEDWSDYVRYLLAARSVDQVWRVLHAEPSVFASTLPVSLPSARVRDVLAEDFSPLVIV